MNSALECLEKSEKRKTRVSRKSANKREKAFLKVNLMPGKIIKCHYILNKEHAKDEVDWRLHRGDSILLRHWKTGD